MASLSSIIDDIAEIANAVGVTGEARTREFSETYEPTTASRLDVTTKNGAIDLHPTDGDELTVDATAKTRHDDVDLDAVSIEFEEDGEMLSVTAQIPTGAKHVSVDLDVGVPDSLAVRRVVSKNGKIEARDVAGDARFETKNGKIDIERVDGTVTALTKNGMITVRDTPVREVASKNGKLTLELPALTGDVAVETKNGKITIAVPADVDADYHLDTTRGRATVDGLSTLVESSSKTHVTGELGAGGPYIDARTKNGTVTLTALHRT